MIQTLRALGLGLLLSLGGCGCDETPVSRVCVVQADCPAGQFCDEGICRDGQPICLKGVIEENCQRCAEHSDCPDGARCSRSGLCLPPQCDTDADCTNLCSEQGSTIETCQAEAESGWRQCVPFVCETDAQCSDAFVEIADGLTAACVARGCRCRNPCGGTCGAGTVCCGEDGNEQFGQCIDDPGACGDQQCGLGYDTEVIAEGEWSMSQCGRSGDECRCIEKAPLPLGVTGIQSAVAVQADQAIVAAYNSTYGDLWVGLGDEEGLSWQWVDGLPLADAENVTGGPSGPRFGVSAAGADTGRFPSIAVARNGTVHLVYQDVDERSLVYARSLCGAGCDEGQVCTAIGRCVTPTSDCDEVCAPGLVCLQGSCAEDARPNKYLIFELDGRGEVGYHNALTLDRNGIPHILSAAHRFDHQGIQSAEWRRYTGSNDLPNGAEDFGFMDGSLSLDPRLVSPLSVWACEGGCPDEQVCVGEDSRCVTPTEDCNPGCGDGEACASGQCVAEIPAQPRGGEVVVNAHNTLMTDDQGRVLGAWYDTRNDRPVLLEPNGRAVDVQTTGGQFVALRARGADRHLAFIRNEQVLYVRALPDGTIANEQVVDNGARQLENRSEVHVLADTALDLAPDGTLTLYWQDATDHTLRYATKAPGDDAFGQGQVLAGQVQPYEGSYGFSNQTARHEAGHYVSSFRFHLPEAPPESEVVIFAR